MSLYYYSNIDMQHCQIYRKQRINNSLIINKPHSIYHYKKLKKYKSFISLNIIFRKIHSMGAIGSHHNITISVQPPQKDLFNFHKDYKEECASQTISYPSYIKKSDATRIEYCQRSSYNNRQYEINYEQTDGQPSLVFHKVDGLAEKIWKNISPNETVALTQGDILRLADTRFQIKKICRNFSDLQQWEDNMQTISQADPRQSINLNLINSRRLQQSHFMKYSRNMPDRSIAKNESVSSFGFDMEGEFCRYCYGRDSVSANPLLNICKCSGSVKFSHYYCLKNWITSRSTTKAADCYEYFQYDLSCQVCKSKISKSVMHKGKKYVLYSDSLIHPPFVVMSYCDEGSNKVREFIINFDYSSCITIGKGSNSNLQLNNKLISSEHCQLIFENNRLLLQNRNPTYGSFICVEEEWMFSPVDNQLEMMVGNHLIRIKDETAGCFWNKPLKLKIMNSQQN